MAKLYEPFSARAERASSAATETIERPLALKNRREAREMPKATESRTGGRYAMGKKDLNDCRID